MDHELTSSRDQDIRYLSLSLDLSLLIDRSHPNLTKRLRVAHDFMRAGPVRSADSGDALSRRRIRSRQKEFSNARDDDDSVGSGSGNGRAGGGGSGGARGRGSWSCGDSGGGGSVQSGHGRRQQRQHAGIAAGWAARNQLGWRRPYRAGDPGPQPDDPLQQSGCGLHDAGHRVRNQRCALTRIRRDQRRLSWPVRALQQPAPVHGA